MQLQRDSGIDGICCVIHFSIRVGETQKIKHFRVIEWACVPFLSNSNYIPNECMNFRYVSSVYIKIRVMPRTSLVKVGRFSLFTVFEITEKVAFNIASEAGYVYILSGQKFIKNANNGQFWQALETRKLAVKQCY